MHILIHVLKNVKNFEVVRNFYTRIVYGYKKHFVFPSITNYFVQINKKKNRLTMQIKNIKKKSL